MGGGGDKGGVAGGREGLETYLSYTRTAAGKNVQTFRKLMLTSRPEKRPNVLTPMKGLLRLLKKEMVVVTLVTSIAVTVCP